MRAFQKSPLCQPTRSRMRFVFQIVSVSIVLAICGMPAAVFAQRYVPIAQSKLKKDASFSKSYARRPSGSPADKQRFKRFITEYYIPLLTAPYSKRPTVISPVALGKIGKYRLEFFKLYIYEAPASLQKEVTSWSLDLLWNKIVRGKKIHPAAQHNAILMIGMLDSKYVHPKKNPKGIPVPLSAATVKLVQIVIAAETKSTLPASWLNAALVGLERHARYSEKMDPKVRKKIIAQMKKIIALEHSVQNTSDEVHQWIQCQAASVLANFKDPQAGYSALVHLISSEKLTDENRCLVATLLSRLDYKASKVDSSKGIAALNTLLKKIGKKELGEIAEFQKQKSENITIGGGGFNAGGRGFGDEKEESYPRNMILYKIDSIHSGYTTLLPVAGNAADQVSDTINMIDEAMDVLKDKRSLDLPVTNSLRELFNKVMAL